MKSHLRERLVIFLLILLPAILTTAQVDVEEVTDLDSANDLNELLHELEGENIDSSVGGVDQVEGCDATIVDDTSIVNESSPVVDEQVIDDTVEQQLGGEIPPNESPDNVEDDETAMSETERSPEQQQSPAQTGPFIDILGDVLLSLEMVDDTHAQVHQHLTNDALAGKKVVGLYFSADWYVA